MKEFPRHLMLSTAHVAESTSHLLNCWARFESLDEADQPPFRVEANGEYGWVLFLRDDDYAEPEAAHLTRLEMPELIPICVFAREHDCYVVIFDRDEEKHEEFTEYEW